MKVLFLHAHHDDYEFTAAGTFELWRRKLGADFTAKVVVCTDGKAGHHFRTREETGALRLREQAAAAAMGVRRTSPGRSRRSRCGAAPRGRLRRRRRCRKRGRSRR
jgi:LmbE family N-acetylglucosaminyl deacetylase